MKPEIFRDDYFEVETDQGTECVPCSVAGYDSCPANFLLDYLEGNPLNPNEQCESKHGWVCRLSASGYTDCTGWMSCKTKFDCERYLEDMYGDDNDEPEEA